MSMEPVTAMTTIEAPLARLTSHVETEPPVFGINDSLTILSPDQLYQRMLAQYTTPLPNADTVFPYLHGISLQNHVQSSFFSPNGRTTHHSRFPPPKDFRGLLLVKIDTTSAPGPSLIGSVTASEVLDTDSAGLVPRFMDVDPLDGISIRNFGIQVAKYARLADIVVYPVTQDDSLMAAKVCTLIQAAQLAHRDDELRHGNKSLPNYQSFLLAGDILDIIERDSRFKAQAESVIDYNPIYDVPSPRLWDLNLGLYERLELLNMSKASAVYTGTDAEFWIGNTMDYKHAMLYMEDDDDGEGDDASEDAAAAEYERRNWMTFARCKDGAQLPSIRLLDAAIREANGQRPLQRLNFDFPASGSFSMLTMAEADVASILSVLKLMYARSKHHVNNNPSRTMIHSSDGYRSSSFLAIGYMMFLSGRHFADVVLDLHKRFGREFLLFQSDVNVLTFLEPLILEHSPAVPTSRYADGIGAITVPAALPLNRKRSLGSDDNLDPEELEPSHQWVTSFDGSLPAKILPHLYLGSLAHANNPQQLIGMGIRRILSVGEHLEWLPHAPSQSVLETETTFDAPCEGIDRVLVVERIQDDGIDSLIPCLDRCLQFLQESYDQQIPTLVHCRVGVSRSAAVCIAEVVKRLHCSLPEAYLHVRVHRLNVIIQPNLRFMYELLQWQESYRPDPEPNSEEQPLLRELDWPMLCREIADMNRAYF